jgi:hypothetical protein
MHNDVWMLRPKPGLGQDVKSSQLSILPHVEVREVEVASGNILQRTVLASGQSVITSTCTVETADEIAENPDAEFTLVRTCLTRCSSICCPAGIVNPTSS